MIKQRQYTTGQVNTEYVILMAFVVVLFFSGNPSSINFFLNTIKTAFEKFSGFISIPL